MTDKKIVEEHYQKHVVTEIEHIPSHDQREDTLTFRSSKKQLEKIEHLGCYICGTMNKRESHHIFERCWANAYDFVKVAKELYNNHDYYGHCKRDFKSEEELLNYFIAHYNGNKFVYVITYDDGTTSDTKVGCSCDDEALDSIYNQLILCDEHHRGEGKSAHGSSFATMVAWTGHREGYELSMSPKEYEELAHKEVK